MKRNFLGGTLILLFLLCPFVPFWRIISTAQGYQIISEDTVWTGQREITENYIIESGAKLIIEKGSRINFSGNFIFFYVEGFLDIRGTVVEPVVISGPGGEKSFSISIQDQGEARIRNAEIHGGGNGIFMMENNGLLQKAWASGRSGALTVDEGKLDVQNTFFLDNYLGVKINEKNKSVVKVNRSSFANNTNDVECRFVLDCQQSDFKYNWWGNSTGPELSGYDQEWNKYDKIRGNISIEPYRANEEFVDPVILIPGITGSWEKDGVWEMDPITHTYENLYESLVLNGYIENWTLFEFPYQWRDSNVENARLLRDRIGEIKEQKQWPKVDLVAHSMGGLLAREYIQSEYYGEDVDQLITLGTPHLGAPDAYPKWEAGSWSLGFVNLIFETIFRQEAEKAGYESIFDYIRQRPILSVSELLPVYDYLFDKEEEAMRAYPFDYPINSFLERLNEDDALEQLKKVEFSKIIGEVGDEESTVAGFEVLNEDLGEYWVHGYPDGFEFFGNQGMIRDDGDGTVPSYSAQSENIYADNFISLNSSHAALPTMAQDEIFKILTGDEIGEKVERSLVENILIFTILSPVDVQVIDPENKIAGSNLAGGDLPEIAGAFYGKSGDPEVEFITIPNPQEGEYRILTKGVGDGPYEIKIALVSQTGGSVSGGIVSEKSLKGVAVLDEQKESKVIVEDGKIGSDITPPQVEIISPKNGEKYLNNQAVGVDYEINDDVSATENVEKTVKLDGENFAESEIELWLMKVGEHKLKIEAQDEAGNVSEEESLFRSEASFRSVIDNVGRYYESGLITSRKEKDFLIQTLKRMQTIDNFRRWLTDRQIFFRQKRALDRILRNLDRAMEREIKFLIKRIENKEGKTVASQAAVLLIDSLEYIRLK